MPGASHTGIVKNQHLQIRNRSKPTRVKNLDLWQFLKKNNKPVIVYGTGNGADKLFRVMSHHGIEAAAVAASEGFVRQRSFHEFTVESINTAIARLPGLPVLLAFGSRKREVLDYIYNLAEQPGISLFVPDLPVTEDAGVSVADLLFDQPFFDENRARIERVRRSFADECSCHVFDCAVEYKLTGRIAPLRDCFTARSETLSLIMPGLKRQSGSVFMDVGAFDGDTIQEFLELTDNNFDNIIAVEPDVKNLRKLRRRHCALGDETLVTVNAAVCDRDGETAFHMGGGMHGSIHSNRQNTVVPCATVDTLAATFAPGQPITYINIDAEGAEAAVLNGAAQTIKRDKPVMIIAAYHRPRDILDLPEQILALNPEYTLYLRKQECLPCWEMNIIVI
jgi:FkbM family methyltransferase